MLELNQVSYHSIVKNCTIHIPEGKLTTILGRNGAGKSTLLKLASGDLVPSSGAIRFNHMSLQDYSPRALAKTRAILSQSFTPNDHLQVLDFLRLARHPYSPLNEYDYQLIDEFVEKYQLQDFLGRNLTTLSGGEIQRLRFLAALLQISPLDNVRSKMLFLDEITNSLDLSYQLQFLRLLRSIVDEKNVTVLMILHDFNLARQISDFVILMEQGQIVQFGSPETTLTAETLQSVFTIEAISTQLGHQTYLLPRI